MCRPIHPEANGIIISLFSLLQSVPVHAGDDNDAQIVHFDAPGDDIVILCDEPISHKLTNFDI